MTIVLATATPMEMKAVLTGFNGRGRFGCKLPAQGEWCESPVNGHDCLLAVTGIGPVNAAFTLGKIVGERTKGSGRVECVINLGVAGAFDTKQTPKGEACLITREISPEYGLATDSGVDARGIGFPQWRQGEDNSLENAVWDTVPCNDGSALTTLGLHSPCIPRVTSLSVAGVTGTAERAHMLQNRYNAQLENMEGFALALGCFTAGIPFIELRTVSNLVGSRASEDWDLEAALLSLGKAAREIFV